MQSNLKTFFAVWKKYCKEARVDAADANDVRRDFIGLHFPEKRSLTQCTASEIGYLIAKINELIQPQEMPTAAYQDGQQMRRKIIAILCELYDFRKQKNGKVVPDMTRINAFLKQKTAFKCELNSLTIEELPKVVTQMDELQKKEQTARRKKMEVEK